MGPLFYRRSITKLERHGGAIIKTYSNLAYSYDVRGRMSSVTVKYHDPQLGPLGATLQLDAI